MHGGADARSPELHPGGCGGNSSARRHLGGQDTPYPYQWEQQGDGSVRLEISHEDAPDCRWTLKEGGPETLEIQRAEKERGGRTVFELRSGKAGRALFTLLLQAEGESPEPRYELSFQTEALAQGDSLQLSILNSAGRELQGSLSGGEAERTPYRIYTDAEGRLVLALSSDSEGEMWDAEILSGAENLVFLGMEHSGDQILAYFQGGSAGEFRVALSSQEAAARITLQGVSGGDGALRVTEHNAEYWEKPVIETLPQVLETLAPGETLPEEDPDATWYEFPESSFSVVETEYVSPNLEPSDSDDSGR